MLRPSGCFQSICDNLISTGHATGVSQALGIESLQSLFPDKDPKAASNAVGAAGRKKLQDAEDSFQSSELLKRLREQTTLNSKKYYTALPLCIACIHDVSICPLCGGFAHPFIALTNFTRAQLLCIAVAHMHSSYRNKIDLQNKYCYRQAELGIGDCGGLSVSHYIVLTTMNYAHTASS